MSEESKCRRAKITLVVEIEADMDSVGEGSEVSAELTEYNYVEDK